MALVLADRVQETTTTTGTGTVTLSGAVSGFQSFSAIGNGNTTYYTIADQTGTNWEVGLGTYTASGTTLSRDSVLSSSNSGSLVNFGAGTKNVFVTYPASKAVYNGGALGTPSSGTATNLTGLPLSTGVTGQLAIANGGTGQSTQTAAFDALAPTTTKGDLVVYNGTDNVRLGVGTNNYVLTADSAQTAGVKWAAVPSASPGGSDTQVQFNDSGSFGGDAGLTYNKTTDTLTTSVVVHGAGTASAPSVTTTGDTNTGVFFPAADTVGVATGGAERVRIDSSGNVGIGVTPSAWYPIAGYHALQVGNTSLFGRDGTNSELYLNANSYDNSSGNATYISTDYASRYNQNDGAHAWFTAPSGTAGSAITFTERMRINQDGTIKTASTISVGNATPSTSGAGITFPATQSASSDANTLDDYEEGVFTAQLKFGGNSTSMTGTFDGKYTKVGNVVNFVITISLTAKGSSTGSATITGLPFTSASSFRSTGIAWTYNMASMTGSTIIRVDQASTTCDVYQDSSTGSNNALTNSNFNNDSQLRVSGLYLT